MILREKKKEDPVQEREREREGEERGVKIDF